MVQEIKKGALGRLNSSFGYRGTPFLLHYGYVCETIDDLLSTVAKSVRDSSNPTILRVVCDFAGKLTRGSAQRAPPAHVPLLTVDSKIKMTTKGKNYKIL